MNAYTQQLPGPTRRVRIDRVRKRLSRIEPQDQEMRMLINAVKGLLDIVADDGDDFE